MLPLPPPCTKSMVFTATSSTAPFSLFLAHAHYSSFFSLPITLLLCSEPSSLPCLSILLVFYFCFPPYSFPTIICLFILLSCPRADPLLYHPSSMSVYRPFTLTVSHSTAYHPGFSSPCLPRLSLQSSLLSSSQVLHRIPYLCPPHIHNLSLYDSDIGCLLFSVHNIYYVWALDQTLADV